MVEAEKNLEENPEFLKLNHKIERLKSGEAIIMGGAGDVEYIQKQIEKLRGGVISTEEADLLLEELKTVDPSLSTYEARQAREKVVKTLEHGIRSKGEPQEIDIPKISWKGTTMEEAQKIVDARKLEDGIYTVTNPSERFFIVVKSGKVEGDIFKSPTYDVSYLKRATGLSDKGSIRM